MDWYVIMDVALKVVVLGAIIGLAWRMGFLVGGIGPRYDQARAVLLYPYVLLIWTAISCGVCAFVLVTMPDIPIDPILGFMIGLGAIGAHGIIKRRGQSDTTSE